LNSGPPSGTACRRSGFNQGGICSMRPARFKRHIVHPPVAVRPLHRRPPVQGRPIRRPRWTGYGGQLIILSDDRVHTDIETERQCNSTVASRGRRICSRSSACQGWRRGALVRGLIADDASPRPCVSIAHVKPRRWRADGKTGRDADPYDELSRPVARCRPAAKSHCGALTAVALNGGGAFLSFAS
jgi:hypothetical protein